jgi:hypothetical protein
LDGSQEAEVLSPEILDENGYFEEESFLISSVIIHLIQYLNNFSQKKLYVYAFA